MQGNVLFTMEHFVFSCSVYEKAADAEITEKNPR